ncbi:MAG: OpgC domain-containing protein [Candidatus Cloacimonadales bacterium]
MGDEMGKNEKIVRDLRIDFFRGIALLIIVANHIDLFSQKFYFKFSFKWLHPNFSDAAEIFVFLSGYVYGLVYYKYLLRNNFKKLYFKSFLRAVQLYVINLFTLVIILALYSFFQLYLEPNIIAAGGCAHFFSNPKLALIYSTIMLYAPALINVLPLYIVLLLTMPFFLKIMQKNRIVALLISFAIYLLPHIFTQVNFPAYPFDLNTSFPWSRGWAFNPFAWQFLFVIAMFISVSLKYHKLKIPHNKILISIAISLLIVATIPRFSFILQKYGLMETNWIGQVPGLSKRALSPLRFVHFFSLLYLVKLIFPIDAKFFQSKIALPFIRCGQHSLEVFSFGIILTYASYYTLEYVGINEFYSYLITFISWGLMLVWAKYLENKKSFQRK